MGRRGIPKRTVYDVALDEYMRIGKEIFDLQLKKEKLLEFIAMHDNLKSKEKP